MASSGGEQPIVIKKKKVAGHGLWGDGLHGISAGLAEKLTAATQLLRG